MSSNVNNLEAQLIESSVEQAKLEALQKYKSRKRMQSLLTLTCILCISAIGIWYWYEPEPDTLIPVERILKQSGNQKPDILDEEYQHEGNTTKNLRKENQGSIKITINDDTTLFLKAQDAFLAGNWPLAIERYGKLQTLYNDDINIMYNLAISYHYMKNYMAAKMWYQKILKYDPTHSMALKNLSLLTA